MKTKLASHIPYSHDMDHQLRWIYRVSRTKVSRFPLPGEITQLLDMLKVFWYEESFWNYQKLQIGLEVKNDHVQKMSYSMKGLKFKDKIIKNGPF